MRRLVVALAFAATGAAAQEPPPVVREDFSGGVSGWRYVVGGSGEGGGVQAGDGTIILTPGSSSERSSMAVISLPAAPYQGRIVRVSGDVRRPVGAGAMPGWIMLGVDAADGHEIALGAAQAPAADGQWARVEQIIIVPELAETLRLGVRGRGGAIEADNLVVEVLDPPAVPLSPQAEAYLNEALDLLEEHHLNRASVDWPRLRDQAVRIAGGAQTTADTYPAIDAVIAALGEMHSWLEPPAPPEPDTSGDAESSGAAPSVDIPLTQARLSGPGVPLLALPGLNSYDREGADSIAYRDAIQQAIAHYEVEGACGWIVDLRGNQGGNMWPMLAGLEPLLDAGPFGGFGDRESVDAWWRRTADGIAPTADAAIPTTAGRHADDPVAVLIGPLTASSGEMTAIAFVGRERSRTFGQHSAGFTTANDVADLSDGAHLILTMSVTTDRDGRIIERGLSPDEITDDPEPAALAWLGSQGCPAS